MLGHVSAQTMTTMATMTRIGATSGGDVSETKLRIPAMPLNVPIAAEILPGLRTGSRVGVAATSPSRGGVAGVRTELQHFHLRTPAITVNSCGLRSARSCVGTA